MRAATMNDAELAKNRLGEILETNQRHENRITPIRNAFVTWDKEYSQDILGFDFALRELLNIECTNRSSPYIPKQVDSLKWHEQLCNAGKLIHKNCWQELVKSRILSERKDEIGFVLLLFAAESSPDELRERLLAIKGQELLDNFTWHHVLNELNNAVRMEHHTRKQLKFPELFKTSTDLGGGQRSSEI